MLNTSDLENMGKAIEEIGQTNSCVTGDVLKNAKRIVQEKGIDAAEIYAAQLTGTDQNTELMRVFNVCRKYGLSPEATAQVLDKLNYMTTGKW